MVRNVIVLICIIHYVHLAVALDCLSTNGDSYNECHMSTRTAYRYIANYNDSEIKYPGCTEKKIWLFLCHGTRQPAKKVMARMNEELPKLRDKILHFHQNGQTNISAEAFEELVKWNRTFDKVDATKLTEEGERELTDLAERFQSRFPIVLPEVFSNRTYKIKYTTTQRTEKSAESFALGLFGRQASQKVWYHPSEKKDSILRPYKHCNRWREEVKNNTDSYEQENLFIGGKIVKEMLDDLSKKIGFPIKYGDVDLMYHTCGFETAWNINNKSPWCKLLSLDHLKVLEYADDLDNFWIDGYGFPITYKQSCRSLVDVFQFFNSKEDGLATIYFGHSGSMLKLLSLLGLAKDVTPLRHDSFDQHRDTRAWKTSLIDAFASNLGFILYECEKEGPSILAMHQERVIEIPGCPKGLPCPISTFESLYSESIHDCRYEEICGI